MHRLLVASVWLATTSSVAFSQTSAPADALVQKIQGELSGPPTDDSKANPQNPRGEWLTGTINDSAIYPGTENPFSVYVPAHYDPAKPACLLVKLDGFNQDQSTVLDNLIASKEIPMMIAVGIVPGSVFKDPPGTPKRRIVRFNRSYEFDSVNDHFADFVLNEVLPAVAKMKTKDGRAINISPDPNDHAATGASTGGIGSFTLAWRRPDQFRRVYDVIGTFVSMRGGHEYPALIRKTDPKPIRIFLEDGSTDAWNPLFGSWFDANVNMESALTFAGYDVAHAWGTHGHDGKPGAVIFPDVMRWLWRDYPAPIKAGISKNNMLQDITLPGEDWQDAKMDTDNAGSLAADAKGDVTFAYAREEATKSSAETVAHGGGLGTPGGVAYGPDGTLYCVGSTNVYVAKANPPGAGDSSLDVAGRGIVVNHDGTIYVSEPGEHSDMPSKIWMIKPGGEKKVVDEGLSSISGVALSPDGSLLYAAEHTSKWIYSYVVQPDGTLTDKQPYFWLHMTDIPSDSGAEDLAVDTKGNLYVATRMGVQVCDQNGRVRAILPLPTPCGPARGICFGGPNFDILYVSDGTHVFQRKMKLPGFPPWSAPITVPSQGAG
jgi:hypothetical protein